MQIIIHTCLLMVLRVVYTPRNKEKACLLVRVKSGKLGHQVNSDTHFANSVNPDETAPYEPSHPNFHCLLSLFNLYSNHSKLKEILAPSEFRGLSEFTRLYPTFHRLFQLHQKKIFF